MPYIDGPSKERIELQLRALDVENWTEGQLAFALFRMLDRFVVFHPDGETGFKDYALASGIFTETLAEWRRRRITPYEKKKIKENGDVA